MRCLGCTSIGIPYHCRDPCAASELLAHSNERNCDVTAPQLRRGPAARQRMLAVATAGEELGDITNSTPSAPSALRNCPKCKQGKGRCANPDQPGHLPAAALAAKPTQRREKRQGAGVVPDASILGCRCSVEWAPGEVYSGVVRNVDGTAGKVLVRYDDGDKQWEPIAEVLLLSSPSDDLVKPDASDEEIARALQRRERPCRERRPVILLEPPGTSGEPQLAKKPKPQREVACTACKVLFSHVDVGVTASEAAELKDWVCGVCLGTHEKHWRKSKAYMQRDFGKYRQIQGEQWQNHPVAYAQTEKEVSTGSSWSEAEDDMLRSMCLTEGTGEWASKAARFTAGEGRTGSSLRQRWAKLRGTVGKAAAGGKPARVSGPGAGAKRSREELTVEQKNCKICRSGKGQCRHWNERGHLQSR